MHLSEFILVLVVQLEPSSCHRTNYNPSHCQKANCHVIWNNYKYIGSISFSFHTQTGWRELKVHIHIWRFIFQKLKAGVICESWVIGLPIRRFGCSERDEHDSKVAESCCTFTTPYNQQTTIYLGQTTLGKLHLNLLMLLVCRMKTLIHCVNLNL